MLTAAVRDLSLAHPGKFLIDVRTSVPSLWDHNPILMPLPNSGAGIDILECEYPTINDSNRLPGHFLGAFHSFLAERLGVDVRLTDFKGDVHLSDLERADLPCKFKTVINGPYWLVSAGGKRDFTIKWWDRQRYQSVVDHFRGRLTFVQIGAAGHFHPKLEGAIDLRGKTSIRELIHLVHHASGALSPVSFLMHLSAAVDPSAEMRSAGFDSRPCVVIAGGREAPHWEAYPTHQFIHTVGALDCCRTGGCWRSRTHALGDGTEHDSPRRLCVDVVKDLPRCMDMITAQDVIRRIEMYLEGGTKRIYRAPSVVRADIRPIKAERSHGLNGNLAVDSASEAITQALNEMRAYPEGRFGGRGIVICGGGVTYTACAWVCIQMLRRAGCTLPIQLWHFGENELPPTIQALFAPLGVECVDAIRMRRRHPARRLGGWELKAYAILNSRFEEVMLLDADNVPLMNVERLFESNEFQRTGAVFWPDLGRIAKDNPIWEMCGIAYRDEPEFESGQLLVSKRRCWRALSLALWMNEHSDFFYKHIHGDKETFHLAFRRIEQEYSMPAKAPRILKATLLQHDFNGKVIFQHRNLAKWSTTEENRRFPGFKLEATCLAHLRRLAATKEWQTYLESQRSRSSAPKGLNGTRSAELPTKRLNVVLRAPIDHFTGYGLHACQIFQDFSRAGIETAILPTSVSEKFAPVPREVHERITQKVGDHDWELVLHPPFREPLAGRRTVYFTMWESTELPRGAVEKLNRAECVIVPSQWNAECFQRSGVVRPIHVVPLGIKTDIFQASAMETGGICVFGAAGRLADSDPHRKNVDSVIKLFQKAFPNEPDVQLQIKVFPDCKITRVNDPRVRFIQRYMSEEELAGWFRELTCFVSGARAEGWGLMQHQALATGRPLISTRFGGVAEFFTPDIGYEVGYSMVSASGGFKGCGQWAEPNPEEVIDAMRRVYRNRAEAKQKGEAAASAVKHLSWENANRLLAVTLHEAGFLKWPASNGRMKTSHPVPAQGGAKSAAKKSQASTPIPITPNLVRTPKIEQLDPVVSARMSTLGWSKYFPALTDAHVEEYMSSVSSSEKQEFDSWLEVERIYNAQRGKRILSVSLFWKNVDHWTPDLPTPSLELLQNARQLGLVTRFEPWTHYVLPVIQGAQKLKQAYPDVDVRVYLAKDLEFLVPLLEPFCEVRLMKHSSIRHNPGAFWRFLALEDEAESVTIIDADMMGGDYVQGVLKRTSEMLKSDTATWRVPNTHEVDAEDLFVYRPITACGFGTRCKLPIRTLIEAFIWHYRRGLFPKMVEHPERGPLLHFQHPWPGYGPDEWFLATAIYPRLLPYGLTTYSPQKKAPFLFPLDTSLVASMNPKSRIVPL